MSHVSLEKNKSPVRQRERGREWESKKPVRMRSTKYIATAVDIDDNAAWLLQMSFLNLSVVLVRVVSLVGLHPRRAPRNYTNTKQQKQRQRGTYPSTTYVSHSYDIYVS